jgi:hypothetical protein
MSEGDIQGIIAKAEEALHTANLGLDDISGAPHRDVAGVKNVATYGRAATRILNQLRSEVDGFDDWWNKYQEEMESDPLMSYFWDLRNEALKEGAEIGWQLQVHELKFPEDVQPEPEHATSFFIGDSIGGIGWNVELPDGRETKHYINPPDDVVESEPLLPDPPEEHLGEELADSSVEHICGLYVSYIEACISDAREEFLDK